MLLYNEYFIYTAFFLASAVAIYSLHSRHKSRFPPGPAPLPFVGNLFQVPHDEPPKHYAKWKELYGPISYFRIFGRQFVILNDHRVAVDLLEKRSTIHSSRPELPMAKLVGRDKTALFLPAGNRSRETRKLMVSFLSPRSEEVYLSVIEEETYRFLHRLLANPGNVFESIKSLPSAIILKLIYGYEINYEDDFFVQLAEKLGRLTTEAVEPGRWLVDSFPIIQYMPSWLPCMQFKEWAREARKKCEAFTRAPHDFVKSSMSSGRFLPSFTSTNIQKLPGLNDKDEEILMYAAASMYSGGTDTVVSVTKLFFMMMATHPDVQAYAQKELDLLIGDDRAPCVSDWQSLPYINCIIKELLRFNPVVPILVHSPDRNDVYEGYVIPKGAWVMANVWCMSHDPSLYPDPHVFKPERFDKRNEAVEPQCDPTAFIFGFGRRACPGQHFAEMSLFMTIASVLWAFNISHEKDSTGQTLIPEIAFTTGHTVHPKPFSCTLQPRSSKSIAIIEELTKSANT